MDDAPAAGHAAPAARPRVEDRWSPAALLLHGARAGVASAIHARATLRQTRAMVEMIVREELVAAPTTSLNQPISGTRRYAAVRVPLEELSAIKRRLGGTINDVVLAVSTGALRRSRSPARA